MSVAFDPAGALPSGRTLLEASAGTGKTYSLTALVVRAVAERGLTADQLLVVTFTRAATAELRDRVRAQLQEALVHLGPGGPAPATGSWLAEVVAADPAERRRRADRVAEALSGLDAATITTIHGFCQQGLRQIGVRAGAAAGAELAPSSDELVAEVVRDLLLRELADDPFALSPPEGAPVAPDRVEERLREVVRTLLANQGSRPAPAPGTDVDPEVAHRWSALATEAVATVARRRLEQGTVGFDDLVTGMHRACTDPVLGDDVCRALRSRYRLVLVDEFQDTDPLQWAIFSRAFADDGERLGPPADLIVVGDPKQAIYRFRGADVAAYLDAVSDPTVGRRVLRTNHRSDAAVVAGLNALWRGATFGDPRIRYVEVEARAGAPLHAVSGAGDAAVQIRWLPRHPAVKASRGASVDATRARRRLLSDLADHVVELLQGAELTDGPEPRPVVPGDIAVLVPSNERVGAVVDELRARGVAAVRSGTSSVLRTEAVGQWRALLRALADPSDPGRARALALSWFSPLGPADLEGDAGERRVEQLQRRCGEWADWLARDGVHGFFARFRAVEGVLAAVVAAGGGERALTDLEHVAELLHVETGGEPVTPASADRLLERLVLTATEDDEPTRRRIDSDAAAVQVTTVHASKGLEYPIVLVPFSARAVQGRAVTAYDEGGHRWVDAAPGVHWCADGLDQPARKRREDDAVAGDDLRLLYVALTRARHHLVVWWAPILRAQQCALGRVLFGERVEGRVDTTREASLPDDEGCAAALAGLVAAGGGAVAVHALPEQPPPPRRVERPAAVAPTLAVATLRRPVADRTWRRWSFTSMAPSRGIGPEGLAPVRGGVDEPRPAPAAVVAGPVPPPAEDVDDGYAPFPAGAALGVVVHSVLEELDPTAGDLATAARVVVDDVLGRVGSGLDLDPELLAAAVVASVRTPLDPLLPGTALADVAPADRLAELRFDLRLADGRSGVVTGELGRVVAEHTGADDPFGAYFAALADTFGARRISGHLHGSVDAVLRVAGPRGPRFVVVDYKTNRLGRTVDGRPAVDRPAYGRESMVEAMAEHHYPLQALLYLVAVHRYLRWRLPGYDPGTHLGGAGYLFLRGMTGPTAPVHDGARAGVLAWSPPAAVVLAVDRLLAGSA